jgi:hypothetical protein
MEPGAAVLTSLLAPLPIQLRKNYYESTPLSLTSWDPGTFVESTTT